MGVKELRAVRPSSSAQNVTTTRVVMAIISNGVDLATQDYPGIFHGAVLLHFGHCDPAQWCPFSNIQLQFLP
eukprot:COSAG02_NODE_2145_length_9672_cov_1198.924266_5_plen_72_part_00